MPLDTTVGGSTSDSYASVAYADTFFANHYSIAKRDAWAALVLAQKEHVLRRATQIMDTLRVLDDEFGFGPLPAALIELNAYDYSVRRLMVNQRLNFPRNVDIDDANDGFIVIDILDAQCEQAVFLLSADESSMISQLSGIKEEEVRAGPVMSRTVFSAMGSLVAPLTVELMRPYVRPTRRLTRR